MLNIRQFNATDADYNTIVAINTAIVSEKFRSAESWRYTDESRDQKYMYHRDMIEIGGQVIAYGDYGQTQWSFHPQKYFFNVWVHPDREHPDVRKAYLDHVMNLLAELKPIAISTGMLENQGAHIAFLGEQGFEVTLRTIASQLEVDSFDERKYSRLSEKVRDAGITIETVKELREHDDNWQQNLYEMSWRLDRDVPSADPLEKQTFENFKKSVIDNPRIPLDSFFVALDGGEYIGQSSLLKIAEKTTLYVAMTGVLPSHRRLGIATALKLSGIEYARHHGTKYLKTDNEENNPMYQINLRLGFKAQHIWAEFEKKLEQ
jgi:mycothiol synthase